MLPVPKPRGVQCLSESSVAQLIYAIFIVNKTSSSITVPSTKQGPCSDRARSGLTPQAISKPHTALNWPTRPRNISETPKVILSECWLLFTAQLRWGRDFMVLAFAEQVQNRQGEAGCAGPVPLSRIASRTAGRASPSKFVPSPGMGSWPWDHPPGDQCPTLSPEGCIQLKSCCQSFKSVSFMAGFCVNLA